MKLTRCVLLVFVLVLLCMPFLAGAQPAGKTARIGWLGGGRATAAVFLEAFRDGMRERGWVEGKNLTIETRWGTPANSRELAAELAQLKVDVIVSQGPMVFGAQAAAGTIPVVFGYSGDPVEAKLVRSFARPGGNLTGVSLLGFELVGKRLELLKEALPRVTRVAILANTQHAGEQTVLRVSRAAAERLGVTVQYLPVSSARDFEAAFEAIAREKAEAIVAFPDALILAQARPISEFATKLRIPAISAWAEFAEAGNLMTYGPDLKETWRYVAVFVDKILRGAKPADVPVELPRNIELVINLRAAKALGITLPPSLLTRANRIID